MAEVVPINDVITVAEMGGQSAPAILIGATPQLSEAVTAGKYRWYFA